MFLLTNTIDSAKSVLSNSQVVSEFSINNWTWVSIIETIIIVILGYKLFRSKKRIISELDTEASILKESRKTRTNMDDMMQNIHQSKALYDKLKVKLHPDRFVGNEENGIKANILFQSIQENQHNYKELMKLKSDAEQLLGIIIT